MTKSVLYGAELHKSKIFHQICKIQENYEDKMKDNDLYPSNVLVIISFVLG